MIGAEPGLVLFFVALDALFSADVGRFRRLPGFQPLVPDALLEMRQRHGEDDHKGGCQGGLAPARITSYNVCYTKLLRR